MNSRRVVLPILAAGAAAALWWTYSPPTPGEVPAATWRIGSGDELRQARNYDELPPETKLRLSFHCGEPRYVYVFSRSDEDGTLLMFPSPDVRGGPENPLPAGHTVLPGKRDDVDQAWTTRAEIRATTTFVVVAARQPVDELELLLPHLRRWTNSALPNRSMLVTNPRTGEVRGRAREPWPSALLARAAERTITETLVNGPLHPDDELAGVWTAGLRIKERPAK
ncbi:MAG TPA: hypothetical protein ENI87_04865 [bacterium]|nr:hypothetical protein [bacterium]